MAKRPLPCPTVLRQLLRYDPETGSLFWKKRPMIFFDQNSRYPVQRLAARWNSEWAGREALTCLNYGYRAGHIIRNYVYAHRAVWALYHGEWPNDEVDHINGIRDDNRIENLRVVTLAENQRNSSVPRNNTSGHVGVSWLESRKSWHVAIGVNGKQVWLGNFKEKDAAIAARFAAEKEHGYHENHGRKCVLYRDM